MTFPLSQLLNFDTATVSDALDTLGIDGGLEGLHPLDPRFKIAGPAYTVRFEPVAGDGPAPAADYIDDVPPGAVVVIDNAARTHCTVWGDILSSVAASRKIAGTVIHGLCRDVDTVLEVGFPVFARGTYMKSGKNRVRMTATQVPVTVGATTVHPGDIVFGDITGAIAIPASALAVVLAKAGEIEAMERKVLESVGAGMSLREARLVHRYNSFAYQPKQA